MDQRSVFSLFLTPSAPHLLGFLAFCACFPILCYTSGLAPTSVNPRQTERHRLSSKPQSV